MKATQTCSVEGCDRPSKTRGMCGMHVERQRRWGDPTVTQMRTRGRCSIDGCDQPHEARARCAAHYREWRDSAALEPIARRVYDGEATCLIDDCARRPVSRGWCAAHYQRWLKRGDPTAVSLRRSPAIERLRARIQITASGCWEIRDNLNSSGYAWHSVDGGRRLAHRWSYEIFVGPIPPGLDIDHLCRNRICCNPDHLEPVTRAENVARAWAARTAGGEKA